MYNQITSKHDQIKNWYISTFFFINQVPVRLLNLKKYLMDRMDVPGSLFLLFPLRTCNKFLTRFC